MKKDKITLKRAINCYEPGRVSKNNIKRYMKAQAFEDFYGFRYEDCWNLDINAAHWLLIRLVYFRDNCSCIPSNFYSGVCNIDSCEIDIHVQEKKDAARWKTCLNKIIRGLFMYITIDYPNEKEKKIINKGFKLLFDNWESLWD